MVAIMLLLIATRTSVSILIHVISNWFGRQLVEDLGVAITELCRVLLCPYLYLYMSSEQCRRWLKSVEDLQFTEEVIKFQYDGCGRILFSPRARQVLYKINCLLRQGNNFLHPKNHLQGTMSWYMEKVIGFIKARSCDSGGLLGIWGMGGVGKSSLLKLVYDSRLQYDNGSINVMFVRAGIGCTVGQVQQAIATCMRLPIEHNESSQKKSIHDHLNGTSFLLLLDDLWGYLDLEAVGIPSTGTLHKVVLTTRREIICIRMGCRRNNIIKMECFDEKAALRFYSWPQVINRVEVGGKLLHEILPEKKSSSSTASRQPARPHMHTVCDVQSQHPQYLLPGMTDYYKKVRSFTEAEGAHSRLFGVWGMQGVGKTTLLRLVRDSYTGNACFDHIMFVGAGTGCVVTNVQDAIAINLGLDLEMMSSLDGLSRATEIFNYLEHKSFLLLLDDIREPLNWWAIGLPISSNIRQKIILATRTRGACAFMGCVAPNTIEMHCLGEEDAWKLFRGKVGLGVIDDHPQIHNLAKQMVSLCGGLPLALCALGRAMSNKRDPREWRSAYSQLTAFRLKPCEINEKVCTSVHSPLYGWREDSIVTAEQTQAKTTSVNTQN